MYLERRTSQVRTAREMVPSTPALLVYSALNSAVLSRSRAAVSASWCSLGLLMVTVLLLSSFTERMHNSLLGQGMQSLPENFIFITLLSCLSMAGVQLRLCLPSGQVATSLSQSMVK